MEVSEHPSVPTSLHLEPLASETWGEWEGRSGHCPTDSIKYTAFNPFHGSKAVRSRLNTCHSLLTFPVITMLTVAVSELHTHHPSEGPGQAPTLRSSGARVTRPLGAQPWPYTRWENGGQRLHHENSAQKNIFQTLTTTGWHLSTHSHNMSTGAD